jgi:methylmalonyl-CoA/ethylmalonyl-CoA epimerase
MKKVEHIGIAVEDLKTASEVFDKLFGKNAYKDEVVDSEHVTTRFYQMGETKIELLESDYDESAISKFIAKKGGGMHHIAFDVEDIYKEIERLKAEGFIILNETPKEGADNKLVAFLHPKSTAGVLVELCQEKN